MTKLEAKRETRHESEEKVDQKVSKKDTVEIILIVVQAVFLLVLLEKKLMLFFLLLLLLQLLKVPLAFAIGGGISFSEETEKAVDPVVVDFTLTSKNSFHYIIIDSEIFKCCWGMPQMPKKGISKEGFSKLSSD